MDMNIDTDTNKTKTKWKKKFREPPRPPPQSLPETAAVNEMTNFNQIPTRFINAPPLQNVFDMPPLLAPEPEEVPKEEKEEEEKEEDASSTPPPVVEGMQSVGEMRANFIDLWNACVMLNNFMREGIYDINVEVYNSLLLITDKHAMFFLPKTATDKQIRRDSIITLNVLLLLFLIPVIVFASYNWYYLLFDKDGLRITDHVSDYLEYFQGDDLPFYLKPVKIAITEIIYFMNSFFMKTIKKTDFYFIPETIKLYILVFFLFVIFVSYHEEKTKIKRTFKFPLVITIFLWVISVCFILSSNQTYFIIFMFFITSLAIIITIISIITGVGEIFFDVFTQEYMIYIIIAGFFLEWTVKFLIANPPFNMVTAFLAFLVVVIMGGFVIMLLPYTFFFVYAYILFNSFFGYSRFEGKSFFTTWWDGGYANKIMNKDLDKLAYVPLNIVKFLSGKPVFLSTILFLVLVLLFPFFFIFDDFWKDECLKFNWVCCLIVLFMLVTYKFVYSKEQQ